MTRRLASTANHLLRKKTLAARSPRAAFRRLQQFALLLLLLCGWLLAAPALAATCGPATGQGSAPVDYSTYCWLDFSSYNDATARSGAGQNFVFNLPGGATLSFNVKASGIGLAAVTSPSWTGAAFGNAAFTGIPGKPVLYGTASGTSNLSFTSIVLAVGSATNVPYTLVAADGESTNNGESLSFTTNGNPWTQLAQISNGGSVYPTLTGLGTATVTETGANGTVGSYAFSTTGNPSVISTTLVNGGLQGAIFGVKFYAADLIITKSHIGNFIAGGTGSYNLLVHNNGPDTAQGVTTVTDTLPTGLSYASASGSGWTCAAVGQVVTCTSSNTIANGANLPPITLNVNVAPNAAASISNTATVSNPNYNYNTSNDSSTDPTTIVGPNLLVMKSVTAISDPVEGTTKPKSLPGAVMQYQITLVNNGSGSADNNSLVITDPLPANTKFVLGSASFIDGTPNSGLTFAPANVTYSSVGSAGPWTYVPVNDGGGADANVKALKIAPQGIMAGKSGATAPSFSVTFRVVIL
ncbi:MAG: CshA/CshB family fibrillar adhesin-related protein [Rhodanobacter sp.]